MSVLDKLVDGNIKKNDALRRAFLPAGTRCFLLSGDGQTKPFEIKTELVAGWNLKYSDFRGFFRLYYATHDANFERKMKSVGYVAVGGNVYQIRDGDTVPGPVWKIACDIVGGKKFVPPTI